MHAPQMYPGWEVRYPLLADVSGSRECCKDWLKYLSCRPANQPPSMEDLDNYGKHVGGHHKEHSGNGAHLGAWAFTLTKSPTDPLSVGDMIKAVQKLMNQKSCPVKKYSWYLEYKNESLDHPHIHGMYETATGGKIESKHFKRYWKIWDPKKQLGAGFRGGYHRPVKVDEAYSQYIKKDGGIGESSDNCDII